MAIRYIKTVDVDLATGDAYVGYSDGLDNGVVLHIDNTNTTVIDSVLLPGSSNVNTVLVEQSYQGVLPFSYEVQTGLTKTSASLAFTFSGVSVATAEFSVADFNVLTAEKLYQAEPSTAGVILTETIANREIHDQNLNVLVWSNDPAGLSAVKIGAQPTLETRPEVYPENVIRLPRFDWSSISVSRVPSVIVGYSHGGITVYNLQKQSGAWRVATPPLDTKGGRQVPHLTFPVTGITSDPQSENVYVSGATALSLVYVRIKPVTSSTTTTYNLDVTSVATVTNESAVQIQPQEGVVYGVCPKQGTVFSYTLGSGVQEYAIFDNPLEILWSQYHQEFVILGSHAVMRWLPSAAASPIYGSDDDRIVDGDVSSDGLLLIASSPVQGGQAHVRVLNRDWFTVLGSFDIPFTGSTQYQFRKGIFVGQGKALFVAELTQVVTTESPLLSSSSSSSKSSLGSGLSQSSSSSSSILEKYAQNRFYLMDLATNMVVSSDKPTKGSVVELMYDPENDMAVAVSSEGDVLTINSSGAINSAGNVTAGVTAADLAPYYVSRPGGGSQSAVRVYVGSQEGWNDRWDSGELTSTQTSILYGGGDNLVPGQKYWVHIAVKRDGIWSAPQVKTFVVPK